MATTVEAAGLTAAARAVRLILVLADSKRLLGMRYGQWILGAGLGCDACAAMAQDEWDMLASSTRS